MRLPKLAIENYQFTIIMVALLTLSGIVSFITMPRSEDPAVTPPGSNIIVVYPGATPEDMERMIVDPIEEGLNELEDIHKFNTIIEDGLTVISIEFTADSNPDDKYSEVLQKVNRARNDLPDDILLLDVMKWSISDVISLQLALSSDSASYQELDKKADALKTSLERVNGIKKVQVWAVPQREVRVEIDFSKLAQMHIPLNQIIGAIQSSNANIPGGSFAINSKKLNVKTSGAYENLDQIRNTVIHARDNKPVYIKDVAIVDFVDEDVNYYARYNGEKSIFITVTQKAGTNIFDVVGAAKEQIDAFAADLPDYIRLHSVFDQTKSVARRLNDFFSNLSGGMLLVGLVVFLAFGFRTSVIITLVIPLSTVIAIGFVANSGYGLQQMSIVAMVIALGLLVDNAIVVVENILRFRRMGMNRIDSAIQGVAQVGTAVISSTVTTVLAFIPIIFMPGMTGDFIRSMPVTVVYILLVSLLLALTVTPFLASKYKKKKKNDDQKILFRGLNKVVEKFYKPRLEWALNHRVLVLIAATVTFLASLALFPFVGVSFFPKAEKQLFLVNVNMPKGTNLDKTNEVVEKVEHILSGYDNLRVASNIGRGNPRIYYNLIPRRETSNYAQLFVQREGNDMPAFERLVESVRDTLDKIPGTRLEVKTLEQGPPVEAPIAIKILGENLDNLEKIAKDVESIVAAEKGTINIDNPIATSATDLQIKINRDKAAMLGVNLLDIDRTVRAAIAGLSVSKYRDANGDEYNLVVRMPYKDKIQFSNLDNIYVSNQQGMQIPLKQVADFEFSASHALISHFKTQRNVTIKADVLPGYSVDKITKSIVAKLDKYTWLDGYSYYVGGELESREESFGGMGQALIIAIIGIFGVLVLQFKSFSQPFIVYAALPLAIIGSILALFITGYSFSFTAFIGITSLVGIVINNSIILIDYSNQLRAEGKSITDAVMESGQTRFIPIILTTATTIGGLLPLTLAGGSLWAPMGWAIIGGLLVSTMLTLLVVPVLYSMFSR
ncbi:efflux RND transporter permease subunit [candidate division KSB1 bacterium]|nr:efflux RND transporter permease subunit [candidate division KSB1 bacterium]